MAEEQEIRRITSRMFAKRDISEFEADRRFASSSAGDA